jgi:hypothetical protein
MSISFSDRIKVPDDVLISGLQGESVILNLESERYFGLDDVGTRFLTLLSNSDSIQFAYEALLEEYDVEPEVLRNDLNNLVTKMLEQGLVELTRE